jgi:hypothetical protein
MSDFQIGFWWGMGFQWVMNLVVYAVITWWRVSKMSNRDLERLTRRRRGEKSTNYDHGERAG